MFDTVLNNLLPEKIKQNVLEFSRAKNIITTIIVTMIAAPLYALVYYLLNFPVAAMVILMEGLVIVSAFLILRYAASVFWAGQLVIFSFSTCLIWLAYVLGGITSPPAFWLVLAPLVAFFYGGVKMAISASAYCIIAVLFMYGMQYNQYIFPVSPVSSMTSLQMFSIVGLMLTILCLVYFFEKILTEKNIQLERQHRIVEKAAKQIELEKQLIKSNQELEQFAYIVSHDLKAPLRAIERIASWIEEDNHDTMDKKSKENLILLRNRVIRMSNLISGILEYSRVGKTNLQIQPIDTRKLVQEIIDSLHVTSRFTFKLANNLPNFETNSIPLMQVFSNLIDNSIKHHCQKAGKVEVSVRDMKDFYEFSVIDDGPGIESEYHDKIFQVFQTLRSKDELESTGIGLSIVKKIVETQGGKVTIDSEKGRGATFRFTWPKHPNISV